MLALGGLKGRDPPPILVFTIEILRTEPGKPQSHAYQTELAGVEVPAWAQQHGRALCVLISPSLKVFSTTLFDFNLPLFLISQMRDIRGSSFPYFSLKVQTNKTLMLFWAVQIYVANTKKVPQVTD